MSWPSGLEEKVQRILSDNGWGWRDSIEVSRNWNATGITFCTHRGEFTVAKDRNVRVTERLVQRPQRHILSWRRVALS